MKIGFIGCGNMAKAMLGGILKTGFVSPENVMASAKHAKTLEEAEKQFGIRTGSNCEAAAFADILFLAVKPQFYEEIMPGLTGPGGGKPLIVSMAPGKTLDWLSGKLGDEYRIVRIMPNTPAMVGEGMTGVCPNDRVTEEDLQAVLDICRCFGKAEVVPERLLDVVTGVSGSSPAYIFMIIEAMADAAVAEGMPRAQAYTFAAQAVAGSAKMVLETGLHPGALKDMVCSPGGTTIEAVAVLEEKGLRSALIEAQRACIRKAAGL